MCDFAVRFSSSLYLMSITVSTNLRKFGSTKGHLHVRFCRLATNMKFGIIKGHLHVRFCRAFLALDDHFSVNQHEEA